MAMADRTRASDPSTEPLPTTAHGLRDLRARLCADIQRIERQLASKDRRAPGPDARLLTPHEWKKWRRGAIAALQRHKTALARVRAALRDLSQRQHAVLRLEAEAALELLAREASPARTAQIEAIRRAVRSLG
jgi:hypothetical protein